MQPTGTPVDAEARAEILANPAFGKVFTDHMVTVEWSSADGWHDARLEPYAPVSVDPASVVLHYGQTVFEGMKAYRQPDGGVSLFRPERNAARMAKSSRRLALPEFPEDAFVEACELLVRTDADWVPSGDGASLYLRPFIWATEVGLGVRPSDTALPRVVRGVPDRSWLAESLVVGRIARGWPELSTSYERFGFPLQVRWVRTRTWPAPRSTDSRLRSWWAESLVVGRIARR